MSALQLLHHNVDGYCATCKSREDGSPAEWPCLTAQVIPYLQIPPFPPECDRPLHHAPH